MDNTKAVQLTKDEIEAVIKYHAYILTDNIQSSTIERMKYLDKRFKDFSEPSTKTDEKAANSW